MEPALLLRRRLPACLGAVRIVSEDACRQPQRHQMLLVVVPVVAPLLWWQSRDFSEFRERWGGGTACGSLVGLD